MFIFNYKPIRIIFSKMHGFEWLNCKKHFWSKNRTTQSGLKMLFKNSHNVMTHMWLPKLHLYYQKINLQITWVAEVGMCWFYPSSSYMFSHFPVLIGASAMQDYFWDCKTDACSINIILRHTPIIADLRMSATIFFACEIELQHT